MFLGNCHLFSGILMELMEMNFLEINLYNLLFALLIKKTHFILIHIKFL